MNLSPNKGAVLREVYRVLASGGEMYFSDVYCDRRLPEEARTHPVLVGECLGGALSVDDFTALCKEVRCDAGSNAYCSATYVGVLATKCTCWKDHMAISVPACKGCFNLYMNFLLAGMICYGVQKFTCGLKTQLYLLS